MTDSEARDEMYDVVRDTWDAGATAIVGAANKWALRYTGIQQDEPTAFFGRVSHQIVSQELRSMADEQTFGNQARHYESLGLVFVQIFAPKSEKNASDKGFRLAQLTRDGFRSHGQSGSVTFTNARINTIPEDGSNYRWNVVAEFGYDTIN